MQEIIHELKEKLKTQDLSKSEWLILFIDMGLIKVNQTGNGTEYTLNKSLYPNAIELLTGVSAKPIEASTEGDSGFQEESTKTNY